jgi:hypothetical protein
MKNLNLLEVVQLIRRSLSRIHVYNTWKRNPNVIMQQKESEKKSFNAYTLHKKLEKSHMSAYTKWIEDMNYWIRKALQVGVLIID